MLRKQKDHQESNPDAAPQDIHVKLVALKTAVTDLWNQEDAADKIRRKIVDFELECAACPTITDDQLKRGMMVCKTILDQLPPSTTKLPEGLEAPVTASRLTDHNPLIDKTKGTRELEPSAI